MYATGTGESDGRLARIALVAGEDSVYEPSDDSFALVDALKSFLDSITKLRTDLCVELGCGSGYVICSLALLLRERAHGRIIAIDINPQACACTQRTLQAHKVAGVELVTCDLLQPFTPRLRGLVDLLIFNPPYVPTPDEEVKRDGIARAWAGGKQGRAVVDRILPEVGALLSRHGVFLTVAVAENDPEDMCMELRRQGLTASIVLQRRADEEHLSIIMATRSSNV